MAIILIKKGWVIDPSRNLDGVRDVLIRDGKIAGVEKGISIKGGGSGLVSYDASGKWVVPGIIDMHVHLREPGREEDETIATGTRAAAKGGITSVCAMPNTEPPIDIPQMVRAVYRKALREGVSHVFSAGCITKSRKGKEMAGIGRLVKAGAVAVTDDGSPVMKAEILRRALECALKLGIPVIDHSEDTRLSAGGVVNEGPASRRLGLKGIPQSAEVSMALRNISLAEITGGHIHLAHVSCREVVDALRKARKRGCHITAETCPHYFSLSDEDIPGRNPDFKMNPPLRSREDVKAVLDGLADGTIDVIASDHAPHSPEKKSVGFLRAPFGIIGLETLLPLTLTQLVHKKVITRKRMVELLSTRPAMILGLGAKGSLRRGADADVTIIDPNESFVVDEKFESKSRNSPFIGWKVRGRAVSAIVSGKFVRKDGFWQI